MEILIRYNHNGTNDYERWRVLIDGKEFIVSRVEIFSPCATIEKAVEVNGEMVKKWHITPFNFTKVTITNNKEHTKTFVRIE